MPRPRLAITLGDPNGIGPEVVLKALAAPAVREVCEPVVVGRPEVLARHAARLGLPPWDGPVEPAGEVGPWSEDDLGRPTAAGGALALAAVARACDLCLAGDVEGMVTAPIHKAALHLAGHRVPGHTEFIAARAGSEPLMLMVADTLRVALVTTHVPLRAVPDLVTADALRAKLRLLDAALRRDFGVPAPRLAVLGLNPHAGDEGVLGTEEQTVFAPALAAARAEGLHVTGPHPADAFFGRRADRAHDAVLAPYHDQGLVAFKTLAQGRGVNVTAGLPLVRTSPDHGTAFDIAGRGEADPSSFVEAVRLAAAIARARRAARPPV